jgi:hypothetical protein
MKEEFPENDALWDLLGKAGQPKVSPFFARNVLRKIRQSAPARTPWVLPRWLAPAAFAAIVVGFVITLGQSTSHEAGASISAELAVYIDDAADLEQLVPAADFTPAHLAGL